MQKASQHCAHSGLHHRRGNLNLGRLNFSPRLYAWLLFALRRDRLSFFQACKQTCPLLWREESLSLSSQSVRGKIILVMMIWDKDSASACVTCRLLRDPWSLPGLCQQYALRKFRKQKKKMSLESCHPKIITVKVLKYTLSLFYLHKYKCLYMVCISCAV